MSELRWQVVSWVCVSCSKTAVSIRILWAFIGISEWIHDYSRVFKSVRFQKMASYCSVYFALENPLVVLNMYPCLLICLCHHFDLFWFVCSYLLDGWDRTPRLVGMLMSFWMLDFFVIFPSNSGIQPILFLRQNSSRGQFIFISLLHKVKFPFGWKGLSLSRGTSSRNE